MNKLVLTILLIFAAFRALAGGFSILPPISQYTELMRAVSDNNVVLVKKLIKNGASPNESSKNGATPLMIAVNARNLNIIQIILMAGADPNAVTNDNINSITIAACGPSEILELLLDKNVDPNLIGKQGMFSTGPALRKAVICNNTDNISLLLNKGNNIQKSIKYALFEAKLLNNEKYVTMLVMHEGLRIHSLAHNNGLIRKLYYSVDLDLNSINTDQKRLLDDLSTYELKALKNSIFARKNYSFRSLWLREYYKKHFLEYKPMNSNVVLSSVDKNNIKLLLDYENSVNERKVDLIK